MNAHEGRKRHCYFLIKKSSQICSLAQSPCAKTLSVIARSFSRIALAVACAALIASPQMARAGRPQPVSETKSLHVTSALGYMELESDYPGCAVWFAYKQTGVVNLEAVLSGGMVSGAIGVSVEGRAPGVYTVSAVTASSSNTVVLGPLRVRVSGTSSAGAKPQPGTPGSEAQACLFQRD